MILQLKGFEKHLDSKKCKYFCRLIDFCGLCRLVWNQNHKLDEKLLIEN